MDAVIIKESEDFVIADKPSGLLTIAGRGDRADEITLYSILEKKYGRIYAVHRLDRDVSGVNLFAKNPDAHKYLSGLFETRSLEKKYVALVHGQMTGRGRIDKPLSQRGSGRVSVAFDGKHSQTEWRVMKNYGRKWTLIEAGIITGRRHQIRVHLYSEGHPVAGDMLYGDFQEQKKFPRIMLHSWRLKFRDRSGITVFAEAEPPQEFMQILDML